MYLTRIDLSLRQGTTRWALADCQRLHTMVMDLFGTDRKSAGVLFRLREQGGEPALYLYSRVPISSERLRPGMRLSGQRDLSGWLAGMADGQTWRFDLLASPSKKVAREDGGNSRRRILRTAEERMAWLARKGEQYGFRLLDCQELEGGQQAGRHAQERGGRMYLDRYHYQGVLQITAAERFRQAVQDGIGPGKPYGLGMLLLRG